MSRAMEPVTPLVVSAASSAATSADARVFAELYLALRRFAASVAPTHVDPNDLVHEALVRTLRGGPLGRLEDPLQYLRRVVMNLVNDSYRRAVRDSRLARLVADDDRSVDAYPSDLAMLDELRPDERALLHLVELEGRPAREAAAVIGCTPATARARLMRARRKLRALLVDAEGERANE